MNRISFTLLLLLQTLITLTLKAQPIGAPDMTVTNGLRLWLDAATVVKNGSNKVASWTDLSGQNIHAAQSASNKKPLWVAAAVNNHPVIRFDGSNDILVTPAVTWPSHHYSYFAVFKKEGVAKKQHVILARAAPLISSDGYFRLYSGNGAHPARADAKTAKADALSITLLDSLSYHLVSVTRQDMTAHGTALYVDGLLEGESGNATASAVVTATSLPFYIGAWDKEFANSSIAELIVYERTLTDAERRAVDAYLLAKYFPSQDTDEDAMADWWEILFGLNPLADDADSDLDGDTASNLVEFLQHRNPTVGAIADSDGVVDLKVFTPLEK